MKKILLVIPALGAVYGGPSKIAFHFAAALAKRGLQVDLVATDANGPDRLDVPLGRWIEQDGFRLRYFSRLGRWEYKLSVSLLAWLLRNAARYDFAHVTSCFNFPVAAAALACRLHGTPYAVAPQGMLEPWALAYKGPKKRAYLRLLERPLVLRGARLLQALNGTEAVNLAALRLRPRISVLPNGIDLEETRPFDSSDATAFFDRYPALRGKTLILFLHRVDPKKGLDILAPAYASIRERFPDTHLVVAGPPTAGYEETARGYFLAAGVENETTFTGMLDGAFKRGALAAATVFVAPTYSEGFSMAVLEAMAAGLPCVLTEGCNFPEAATADAARVVPIDAASIAVALMDLLADEKLGRAIGARARALVLANYTWDQIASDAQTLYQQAML